MVLDGPFPSDRGGGAEAQVGLLAAAMRKRRQRVTVVTPMAAGGPMTPVSRVNGVPVCRLRYPRIRRLGGPCLWLALAGLLFARRRRYDVCHVHVARSLAVVCSLVGPLLGKRVVIKVSGSWDLERGALAPDARLPGRIARLCLRRADAWQAISRRIASTLASRGMPPARIVAIPNAVDCGAIRATAGIASRSNRYGDGTRLVFVGRLVEEKDLPTLLEAFAEASAARPALRLAIVGSGPLADVLAAHADALAIADRVEFTGHVEDVRAMLAGADFGVLPSRFEGLSNALLECMAARLPMIASRISGNEDFVRDRENGWLFEPGDRAGLVAALLSATDTPDETRRAMGARARETVLRQAGIDAVLCRLRAVYEGRRDAVCTAADVERSH
nr:glycosyltransferase [Lysobacter chinensis]